MGPITRAGCDSRCPNSADGCEGCRGPVDDPNVNAQKDLMKEYGLSIDDMMAEFNLYNACKGKTIEQK